MSLHGRLCVVTLSMIVGWDEGLVERFRLATSWGIAAAKAVSTAFQAAEASTAA